MANQTLWPMRTRTRALVSRTGNFAPNGAAPISKPSETTFTALRTGVGTFTVTFDDRYVAFLHGDIRPHISGAFWDARLDGVPTVVNGKTVATIVTFVPGTNAAADPPAGASNYISFHLTFKDSSAP
jgi:hypothetical protein